MCFSKTGIAMVNKVGSFESKRWKKLNKTYVTLFLHLWQSPDTRTIVFYCTFHIFIYHIFIILFMSIRGHVAQKCYIITVFDSHKAHWSMWMRCIAICWHLYADNTCAYSSDILSTAPLNHHTKVYLATHMPLWWIVRETVWWVRLLMSIQVW